MFSPDSNEAPNIAVITIVCSWVFFGVAVLAIFLLVWSRHITGTILRLDDYITLAACTVTLALVVQTTWAVLDEGFDKQLKNVSVRQRAVIPKVGALQTIES